MYHLDVLKDKEYKIYRFVNDEKDSWLTICPERGGTVTSFGINGEEQLYLDLDTFYDTEKNIRGGIPYLFPAAGQLISKSYVLNGETYQMPNHGFARNMEWEVVSTYTTNSYASITICLESSHETLTMYPYKFRVELTYQLEPGIIKVEQTYSNFSDNAMPVAAGFHPYFLTQEKQVSPFSKFTRYFDYNTNDWKPYNGQIDLTDLKEALLLEDLSNQETVVVGNKSVQVVSDDNYKYMMLWSQPGKDFMCIEPWMAKTNSFNTKEDINFVQPCGQLKTTTAFKVSV